MLDYVGALEEDYLAKLYSVSDVFCFTSHGEGMPRVMLEAGMFGLCPVAYDIEAHRDLVVSGVSGYLVAVRDARGISRCLELLSEDRRLLEGCATRYSIHVRENFSQDAYGDRIERVFAACDETAATARKASTRWRQRQTTT